MKDELTTLLLRALKQIPNSPEQLKTRERIHELLKDN